MQLRQWPSFREASAIGRIAITDIDPNLEYKLGLKI